MNQEEAYLMGYTITIDGKKQVSLFKQNIGFVNKCKMEKLENALSTVKSSPKLDSRCLWTNVVEKEVWVK